MQLEMKSFQLLLVEVVPTLMFVTRLEVFHD